MDNEIISVIDTLCEKFGIAIDWSTENVFPAVQELISRYSKYLFINNIYGIILSSIGMIVCSIIVIKVIKAFSEKKPWTIDKHENLSDLAIVTFMFGGSGGIISIAATLKMIHNILKIITIPEIYVLEEILKLLEK